MKYVLIALCVVCCAPFASLCAQAQQVSQQASAKAGVHAASNDADALTLSQCYQLALKQSELIAVDAEQIKIAKAHFLEAFGTILPQVSFSRVQTWEHSRSFPALDNSFDQKFIFRQELFSGFREFAAIAAGHYEEEQRGDEKLRAEQLLFVDVSDAFYLLIEEREDLETLETIRDALTKRIMELKTRVELGRSRQSEVVSTQTQLYSLEEQIELIKSQESIARELLEFLTGRTVKALIEPGSKISLKPESEYLAKAASRTDVQAAQLAWKASQKGITIAKSGFLPSVNLESDFYTHHFSTPQDAKWGTFLSVNVPIFLGTTTYGQVKEATSQARQNELLFKRAGRIAVQDIHDAFINAQAAIVRTNVLEKALKSAELNYDLQIKDYNLSVVNNLDVLTAIQNLEDIRRNFNHVFYDSKRFFWQLQVAAGDIDLGK